MSPPMNTATAGGPGQPASRPLPADALIVLPARNLVLFPEMVFPLSIGRPASIAAAQQAVREQRQILVVLQHDPEKTEIAPDDLYRVGTVANFVRYITAPDGTHHIICQGVQRIQVTEFVEGHPFLLARGLHVVEPSGTGPEIERVSSFSRARYARCWICCRRRRPSCARRSRRPLRPVRWRISPRPISI